MYGIYSAILSESELRVCRRLAIEYPFSTEFICSCYIANGCSELKTKKCLIFVC